MDTQDSTLRPNSHEIRDQDLTQGRAYYIVLHPRRIELKVRNNSHDFHYPESQNYPAKDWFEKKTKCVKPIPKMIDFIDRKPMQNKPWSYFRRNLRKEMNKSKNYLRSINVFKMFPRVAPPPYTLPFFLLFHLTSIPISWNLVEIFSSIKHYDPAHPNNKYDFHNIRYFERIRNYYLRSPTTVSRKRNISAIPFPR